ncbi:MAG TPA: BTAD domain-containing putative transcriptional regulator [Actinophytocola sp.]|uniref:BTAD domain-containing putative transcriptional regulator n=1 Tax=Actinophytocola sp. TaxID=1872138 RepID=UPI002DB5FE27|nr:BTAD domain-containing putative transcriptional regulator [Actinophytocola sp.]HEU5472921.1 BTAD domain-containing putative transcriptional regulator [Actinophytocola sp.]
MEFGVLGPLRVRTGDQGRDIGSKRLRQLLTVLLVHRGAVLSSDRLVAAMWGEEPQATALRNLHTYVSRLRSLLHADGDEVLITRPPGYVLQIGREQVDAGRFEVLLEDAKAVIAVDPEAALRHLDEALALWRGAAYAEFADREFVRAEATRLEEVRLTAIEERFDAGLALGRHADLVGGMEAYAAEHPLRERARAQLMLALYRCGRQAEALAIFRAFRQQLDEELGVEPSVALRTLEAAILRQDASLDWMSPPSKTDHPGEQPAMPIRRHGSLPAEVSSLVGRAQDVAVIAAALRDWRIVTLTGVGGVGKTRLALHCASRVAGEYPDGVWWCELAPVADGAAVVHAVAAAVGARQQPGLSIEDSLLSFLATRQLLLVVDNCEHVADHAALLMEAVVRNCPRVTVLATSRVALGVTGERIRPTAPLMVPERDNHADAVDSPAVCLFVDRAQAVRPDLDLNMENLERIAHICRKLDGLPLAIELAAARVQSLNPVDIAARISDRFGLLATARPTVVARHRTLRAVVDWSYDLLSPPEQRVFARLSVFAGGFTLTAAEQVCGEVLVDLLATLVENSLVVAGSTAGQVRYSMLETLRAYGHELLDRRGEVSALRNSHAQYYVALAEEAGRAMRGPHEERWVSILDADFENLRAAHRWAVEQADTKLALRLSAGLYNFAITQFRDEVVSWGQIALGLPQADSHPLYLTVSGAVGEGLTLRGELTSAADLAERALTCATDPDDPVRLPVLKVSTAVALYEGRLDDCFAAAGEMLRLARREHDAWHAAAALLFQGLARTYAGDATEGLRIAHECLEVARSLGNRTYLAWGLYAQGEALALTHPDEARDRYESAIAVAESASSTFAANICMVGLAALLARSGNTDDALRAFRRSVRDFHVMQVWQHQWTTLRNLVQLLIRVRAYDTAATLLGALAAADTDAYGEDADSMGSAAERLRNRLGATAYAQATDRGAAMSPDAAVVFALAAIDSLLKRR